MKRLTLDEFVIKYNKKYNKKYDFSKSEYVNTKVKMKVICPIHGEFWIRPNDLMMGIGCPKCGGTSTYTTEEFINKANKVHNNYFSYGKCVYKGSGKKVIITCPLHGDFEQKANNHLNGANCPECSKNGVTHTFRTLKTINKSTKCYDTETFIEKAKNKWGNKYVYYKVKYIKNNQKVIITCPEHGDFEITPNHFLSGRGCPKCGGNKQLTTEEFINKSIIKHGDKYIYDKVKYTTTHQNVIITCPEHGDFIQSPANHLKGQGCPICNESKLEETIALLLDKNNIRYIRQKRFEWLGRMSLDFYLPDYNIAIECQGEQHFKPVSFNGNKNNINENYIKIQERDKNKLRLCNENKIKLLYYATLNNFTFPYKVFTNLNELLKVIKNAKS